MLSGQDAFPDFEMNVRLLTAMGVGSLVLYMHDCRRLMLSCPPPSVRSASL